MAKILKNCHFWSNSVLKSRDFSTLHVYLVLHAYSFLEKWAPYMLIKDYTAIRTLRVDLQIFWFAKPTWRKFPFSILFFFNLLVFFYSLTKFFLLTQGIKVWEVVPVSHNHYIWHEHHKLPFAHIVPYLFVVPNHMYNR